MKLKNFIENHIFEYKGPFQADSDVLGIECKFKIKLEGTITLYVTGDPHLFNSVSVEIFEMSPVSAYIWGDILKNIEGRMEVERKVWYLSLRLRHEISDFFETIGMDVQRVSIDSIKYIGEIPKTLEYRD